MRQNIDPDINECNFSSSKYYIKEKSYCNMKECNKF